MSEHRTRPPTARDRPDLGTAFWLLAGLAGIIAGAATVASGRFDHLSTFVEVLIATSLGSVTMLAFAPWKVIVQRARDRRGIADLTARLRQFDRDRGRNPIRALKTDRDDQLGRLQRAIHDALTTAAALRLEARRLRRTMDHSIRKETDRATGRLQREAATDPLTGVGNRRALAARLGPLLEASKRDGRPLSLLAIDVDHFKQVNDQLGHAAGDACLAFLGTLLKAGLRSEDCAFRNGGDEFVMIMPGQPTDVGKKVAERICELFRQMAWPHQQPQRPTLSIGVATVRPGDATSPGDLLERADDAMYASKRAGRATITTEYELRGAA